MKKTKKIEAGSEIDSRCLKCKDVTNHTIIAMADDKIAKVECNVCGGRHNYRPAKPETAASAKRKTTRAATVASAKLAKHEALHEEQVAGRGKTDAVPYSLTGCYREGDLLDHPTFGIGVVTEIVMPDKIEVLFRQESKLLICERFCK